MPQLNRRLQAPPRPYTHGSAAWHCYNTVGTADFWTWDLCGRDVRQSVNEASVVQVGAVEGDERRTQAEVREVIDEQQFAALCRSKSLQAPAKRPREVPFTPLDLSRGPPGPELLLALDAEFVALTPAQKKLVVRSVLNVCWSALKRSAWRSPLTLCALQRPCLYLSAACGQS